MKVVVTFHHGGPHSTWKKLHFLAENGLSLCGRWLKARHAPPLKFSAEEVMTGKAQPHWAPTHVCYFCKRSYRKERS